MDYGPTSGSLLRRILLDDCLSLTLIEFLMVLMVGLGLCGLSIDIISFFELTSLACWLSAL